MGDQDVGEERPGAAERPSESGAAVPGRGGRMSRQRKTAAVLWLLRGEDLETVWRSLGVTAATLTAWRDAFLAAGEAALVTRPESGEALESERLKAKLGEVMIERDLLHEKIAILESGRPYGLASVCRAWRVSRATVYRRRATPRLEPPRRPGPVGPMPDTALLDAIRGVLADSPFHGEGHRKVWARLRVRGVRTSRRRGLRLLRRNDLLAPSRVGAPRGPRSHDGTIIPAAVDTMWGTDLTTTITGEGQAAVFIAIDHFSAECVGIHAARQATRFEALEPVRQGVRQHFGGFAKDIARSLRLRHDHGSQYMS